MLLFACAQSYIVVVGGQDDKEYLSTCEYFDAASSKWQLFASLNVKRARAAAASIGDSLFVFGGCNNEQRYMADAEEYTAVSNKWTVMTAHTNVGREQFAAAVVSGRIYIVGGYSQNGTENSAEYYDVQTKQFVSVTPMPTCRWNHAVACCQMTSDVVEAMRKAGSASTSKRT